jgi:hypothetical protein
MKSFFVFILIAMSLPVFAEALQGVDRTEKCRAMMHSKRNMYIEDVEYCQGVMMKDSVEKFNAFTEGHGPSVDCPEAKENSGLVDACRAVGIHKVIEQGKAYGVKISKQDVYACDVDNSHWIFSNYVWFCAYSPKGEIRQLTQKPRFGNCF